MDIPVQITIENNRLAYLRTMRMLCKTACVSTLIAAAAVSLNAQATGRLEGSVTDPAEAAVEIGRAHV